MSDNTQELINYFSNLPKRHGKFIDLDQLVDLTTTDYEEVWQEIVGQDEKGIERLRGAWSKEFIAFCLALSFYQSKLKELTTTKAKLELAINFIKEVVNTQDPDFSEEYFARETLKKIEGIK